MSTTALKNRMSEKAQSTRMEMTSKTKQKAEEISPMPETALETAVSGYIALKSNALEIISENLKNQPLSYQLFDVIKSPSGGTTAFTVPGLSGDEIEKELTGIILDYTTPRAYWDTPDPVEGTPPICYSRDSIVSYPEGKPCSRCVFNDYGSKNGGDTNAKACKESVMLILLRQDNILPAIVRVPVSSKMLFLRYMTRLVGRMIPLSGVVTRITLEKATNKTGQPYSLYSFEAVDTLSPEETTNARVYGQKFAEILNASDDNTESAMAEVG